LRPGQGDKRKLYLGEQGGEAVVGVGGRGQREGEEGGDVPRDEAAAERDSEADGAGDPAHLLGQRAGLDHRCDLLQIWDKRGISHAESGELKLGSRRRARELTLQGGDCRRRGGRRSGRLRLGVLHLHVGSHLTGGGEEMRRRGEALRFGVTGEARLCFWLKKVELWKREHPAALLSVSSSCGPLGRMAIWVGPTIFLPVPYGPKANGSSVRFLVVSAEDVLRRMH
jgi:hypothetical protein